MRSLYFIFKMKELNLVDLLLLFLFCSWCQVGLSATFSSMLHLIAQLWRDIRNMFVTMEFNMFGHCKSGWMPSINISLFSLCRHKPYVSSNCSSQLPEAWTFWWLWMSVFLFLKLYVSTGYSKRKVGLLRRGMVYFGTVSGAYVQIVLCNSTN